jgi:protein-L-isoaspartate(D-aspartate) O-methyltransferase
VEVAMNLEKARFNMIEQQIRPWQVFDERVLAAMMEIPREIFVDDAYQALAYADISIPLGHNQAMLKPREQARLLQALELKGEEHVLEIGTGSGYTAALLAKLARKVTSVDIQSDFIQSAAARLQRLNIDNVSLLEADASQGIPVASQVDAMLITGAMQELNDTFANALKPGGRIACILEHKGTLQAASAKLKDDKTFDISYLFPVEAKYLINVEQPSHFEF